VRKDTNQIVHAIVGCGRVAPNHVDGFRAVPGVALRWACDRQPSVAQEFAKEFGIEQWTHDLGQVLRDPEVDSIAVAVDHAQHAAIAAEALSAGKHVLVEKPIALDVRDARDLLTLAAEKDRVFSVISQHRYDPLVRSVRGWVRDGLLGRILTCTIQLEAHRAADYYRDSYWRGTWEFEGGSALINQGYHCIDIAQSLCGPFTVRCSALSRAVLEDVIETDETLGALFTGPGGVLATLSVTVSSSDAWRSRITLVGEYGTVEFDLDHPNTLHRCTGNAELVRLGHAERDRLRAETAPGVDYYGISHRYQIADFCHSVRTGSPMYLDSREAVETFDLIQSIYRAAQGISEVV